MKYKVIRDRQDTGWGFDLGALTAKEWLSQARFWAGCDDNTDLDNALEHMEKDGASDAEVLGFIDEMWGIEFAPVRRIVVVGNENAEKIKVKVLTKK